MSVWWLPLTASRRGGRQAQLETSLLQWSDAGSTYTRLQRWISDREARLQQVLEHKPRQRQSAANDQLASLGEKKAALRRTNSIMQVSRPAAAGR